MRTARSRTSGEYLFVVLLMMPHPTQELEPPANPARFIHWSTRKYMNMDPICAAKTEVYGAVVE